jgi:hypothetical protein
MASYRDTNAEWINIDSDDSEYKSGPELVKPSSPKLTANVDGDFELLGPLDNINPLAIENTNSVEFLDEVIQDISRLFMILKPYRCISARIQAVTIYVIGVPILAIIALTYISQS